MLAGSSPPRLRLSPLITASTLMILLLHGSQASTEATIQRIAASEFWDNLRLGGFARQSCQTQPALLPLKRPRRPVGQVQQRLTNAVLRAHSAARPLPDLGKTGYFTPALMSA